MNDWYNKTKTPFFILSAITLVLLFSGRKVNFGQDINTTYHIFTIEFQYFGMDSSQLEKIITIPLEEKINEISGLCEMRTVTEQGKISLTAWFSKSISSKKIYLTLRNYVDTLYRQLPSAVQKPRILSSESTSKAVFCFTVSSAKDLTNLRQYIENTIKKKLEGVSGVAEVIVSGGALKEIQIKFDVPNLVEKNLNPQVFAQIVQDANVIYAGSTLHGSNDMTVQFDTKIQTIEQLEKLPVKLNSGYVTAGDLAEFEFCDNKQKEIVRINGEEAVAVQVKASSDANIIKTVSECRKILSDSELSKESYKILTDAGKDQTALLKQVASALLQSFICVILIIPFFYSSMHSVFFILFSIPLSALWTVCQLSALKLNINPDCIAGLSISIGLVSDPMLIIAEKAESKLCKGKSQFLQQVYLVIPAILFSTVTSLLALLPLFNAGYIIPGIRSIIIATGLMLCNSFIIAVVFFPCYAYKKNMYRISFLQKIQDNINSLIIYIQENFQDKFRSSKLPVILYIVLVICPLPFMFLSGKNISNIQQDKILFVTVEYQSEKSPSVIDRQIITLAKEIQTFTGVNFIRSETHLGNAELEVGFSPKKTDVQKLSNQINELSHLVQDGFIFIQNNQQKGKTHSQSFELSVSGDQNSVCRTIAKETVSLINQDSRTIQAVLNFKENPKQFVFYPDRILMAKNGLQTQNIAEILHWSMFQPVIDKWLRNSTEYDIKVSGAELDNADLQTFRNLHVPTANGGVKLESLGNIAKQESDGKIYRLNGQRCAFFTVQRTEKSSTKAVKNIKQILNSIDLPKGYYFRFSKEVSLLKTNYSYLMFLCIFAVVLIFIFLTSLTENIIKTLLIISIIPASVSLPLAIKFFLGLPLHTGDIIGIAIAGGVTVNNAIYMAQSVGISNTQGIETTIKSIISSSVTTILGSLPLCLSQVQGFPKDVAFFMLAGSINSLFVSIFLFPKILRP